MTSAPTNSAARLVRDGRYGLDPGWWHAGKVALEIEGTALLCPDFKDGEHGDVSRNWREDTRG